jgi:hypothetical protein
VLAAFTKRRAAKAVEYLLKADNVAVQLRLLALECALLQCPDAFARAFALIDLVDAMSIVC